MDAIYVDSSVVVAFLLGDSGSSTFKRVRAKAVPLLSSSFLQAEVYGALARERLEPTLADAALSILAWVLPDRPLANELRRTLAAGPLRGADAWHVACALRVSPDPRQLGFATLDRPQRTVATALGFRTALR
jgi:predicted nucleic acid-binding protein